MPWVVLGVVIGLVLILSGGKKVHTPELGGTWIWPLPMHGDEKPVITDGFYSPRPGLPLHGGVDLMYPRKADEHSSGETKAYWIPTGTKALAASEGKVWSAEWAPRGFEVVIDHGKQATYYAHLESLDVKKGDIVKVGQELGLVGISPQDAEKVRHLHFELWLGGPSDRVDPEPIMKAWEVVK